MCGVRGFAAHVWYVSLSECHGAIGEKKVIEWSWPWSLLSWGVSLRVHERGRGWADGYVVGHHMLSYMYGVQNDRRGTWVRL